MSNISNSQHRGRSFERHSKLLLDELEFFSTNIKSCHELLGWAPDSDGKKGLDDLASATDVFARSLRSLLEGNKFWMSDTVTDRSGVRDLKNNFKPNVEALETRVSRAMESVDQRWTLQGLRKAKEEVEGMAHDFEKLREDMLRRILDKTAYANEKTDLEPISPISPPQPVNEKEESKPEPDPYGKHKYLWLALATLILGREVVKLIPLMLLYAISLHLFPAFRIAQAKYLTHDTAADESWQERAKHCPVISQIEKSSPQVAKAKARPRAPSISITAPEEHPAPVIADPSNNRTEEQTAPRDGPGVAFAVSGMAGGGAPAPTMRPRRLSVNGNISS